MNKDAKHAGATRMPDLDAGFLVVGRRYRDSEGNVFTLHGFNRIGRRTSVLVSYDGDPGMVRVPLRAVAPITPIGGSRPGKSPHRRTAAPQADQHDGQYDPGDFDFAAWSSAQRTHDAIMRYAKAAAILMMMIVAVLIVAYLALETGR